MTKISMRARVLMIPVGLALANYPAQAWAWPLISPDEEARDNAAPEGPAAADLAAPPAIDLIRPDISRPLRNPLTIEVRFRAGADYAIDMRTFNATYGRLGINITSRLLEHATTSSNGLSAADVELPTGNHRVTLSIADTSGKSASRTFRFSIVG